MDEFQLAGLEGDDYINARNACNQIAIAGLGWHPNFIIDIALGSSPLQQALNDPTAFAEKQRRLTALFNAQRRMRHQRRSVTKR